MARKILLPLLVVLALPLGGCVAAMAASAVSMAAQGARGRTVGNAEYKPRAISDCTAKATPYGAVHIIDVEQRSPSKLVVWGTVDDGQQRRSFECDYGTAITGFKLRAIAS